MNNPDQLRKLLDSLGMEIITAQAGSTEGQFPILDLLGYLRDEAATKPDATQLHAVCAESWEKMVAIVESGRAFQQAEVEWLNSQFGRLEELSKTGSAAAGPVPTIPPARAAYSSPQTSAAAHEQVVVLDIQKDKELLREFLKESREHLDNIEQGMLVLENSPGDAEILNTVFRAFHTFKGSAGFLNLGPINRLAHLLESLLDLARQDKLVIERPVIELILRGHDVLKRFVDEIEKQIDGSAPLAPIIIPMGELKAEVLVLMVTATGAAGMSSNDPSPRAEAIPGEKLRQPEPDSAARRTAGSSTVKVDTAKLDALLDLVGEIVIAQSLIVQNVDQLAGIHPHFARNMGQLSRITRDLHRVSMSLRMVPIRSAFQKMARVARDASDKQQKSVQLVTSGEDTELDRGIVEELNDPLLHMVRNAVDHGIEPPEKRRLAGKPPAGTLHLRAYHQSGNIVVELEDDGQGLNRDRILAKAIERGLAAPGQALSDEEVFGFIFAPGFSTAEKITDLSGRGVGLDVVRRNVERLRGRVEICSKPGAGALFKITLPLTLAIIDGLIVKVGEERYVIPTLSVRESFRPTADRISRIQGRAEVVDVRGRLVPMLRLYEFLGLKPASEDPCKSIVVVVQSGSRLKCVLVDAILHKQEVVIKNFNEMLAHKNMAFAGAAILGDGRVSLILDVNTLVGMDKPCFSKAA
ncbi:MAG TPA: chemotaxis protein CheA [Verrucomicrobiae bacterium]|nr:chemotaxis protein CheA [Verrucomicrobiae bacterium]